jgi:hypothetical protein
MGREKRKTKTGCLWILARDDRPCGSEDPRGMAFTCASGRTGHCADKILMGISGILRCRDMPTATDCSNVLFAALNWLDVGRMTDASSTRLPRTAPRRSPRIS